MNKIKCFFLLVMSNIVFSFFILEVIGNKLNPILLRYVNIEANRFANNIVNSTVNEMIIENYEEELFIISKNSSGEIESLDYNTKKVNELLLKITDNIQNKLTKLEEGKITDLEISNNFKIKEFHKIKNGVLCQVPLGALKGNVLFSNIGPSIPIKMAFIGQVQSNLNTKITSYGINNIIIETDIIVEVEEQITMPTTSKKNTLTITAPLTIKIIKGTVPEHYGLLSGATKSNTISLPIVT